LAPAKAAGEAMAAYDTNRDGKIDAQEIKQSPPLMVALETMNQGGNGTLTAEQIKARLQAWLSAGTGIIAGAVTVYLDDKLLEGATVTFDPEPFLGPAYQPYSGVTNQEGNANLKGPDEKFPGIYVGLYRVRISKKVNGKETIPARYNTETILGKEIAADVFIALAFRLKNN
jgi:hypothetical protein